jgi:hypothetical protein
MATAPIDFARALTDWMDQESLTIRAAGERIGVSGQAVWYWKTRRKLPSLLARPHIAAAMRIDSEALDRLIDGSHAAHSTVDGAA